MRHEAAEQAAPRAASVWSRPGSTQARLRQEMPGLGRYAAGPGTEPDRAQWYDPVDSFTATSSYQGINPVYLRWGRTNYNLLKGWLGWGYRKIKAKHGWSAAIRGRVATALLTPDLLLQFGTRWVYQMNHVNKRTNCRILVSVQYTPQTFEQTRGYPAAHIVTVYAWKR
jgi:hypothetical protein